MSFFGQSELGRHQLTIPDAPRCEDEFAAELTTGVSIRTGGPSTLSVPRWDCLRRWWLFWALGAGGTIGVDVAEVEVALLVCTSAQ